MNRKDLGKLIKDVHKRKPSYGYHRICKIIVDETGWVISANLVHKVCKILKIKSKAKHYKYKKPGEESVKYENIIGYNWNSSRQFEKIVSGHAERIRKCTLLAVFDDRVFFSGNQDYPNVLWHCSIDDPTYVVDTDYYNEGLDLSPVRALVPGNNA